MEALTAPDTRASFVNCSKGETGRIKLPPGLATLPWADLDFLGWNDPGAPQRSVLVVPGADGPTGVVLRRPESRRTSVARSSMCQACVTSHSSGGVTLFVAPLAGAAGRQGNSVGDHLCTEPGCSLSVRGKRQPRGRLVRQAETLSLDRAVDRLMTPL